MKKILFTLFVIGCIANTNAQVPSYVPTNGLVGYWPFNGNANDESGNGNNGTVNGATLTTDRFGIANSAYSLQGTNQTINYINPFLGGNQVNSFTFNAKIKFNSIANSPNLWGKTYNWGEVNFYIGSNGTIYFFWANSITGNKYSTISSASGVIQTNNWYDITVTFNNGIGQIFVNGNSITTNLQWVAQGGTILSNTLIENSCNFAQHSNSSKIGVRITGGSPGNYLNGVFDEFSIWNRALTEEEVANLYASNPSNECSTLVINTGVLSTSPVTYTSTVNIYPNPANDQITIDCGNLDNVDGWRIKINNMLGQEVFNEPMDTQQYVIPLNTWTGQGMYFVKIINAENEVVNIKKIILQ